MTTKERMSDAEALARFEDGIDVDPARVRTRADIAQIEAAVQMRAAAQGMIDRAVIEARRRGLTWIEIAAGLDVSPQAARKKYHERV